MGHEDPLDGRGVPRDGRFGSARFAQRVGRALALILALAAAPLAPLDAGQETRDPTWDALYQAWVASFQSLRVRLSDPAQRAAAIEEYHAAARRLEEEAKALALPLLSKAYELGTNAEYTADAEERLKYLELAAAAAVFAGQGPAAAKAEQERAGLLESLGRRRAARDVLVAALARPDAGFARPYLEQSLAELERQLGDPARALELTAELLRSIDADASLSVLRGGTERIRDYAYLDLGLPDQAWDGIQTRWKQAEELARAGPTSTADLTEARIALLHLLRAVGDEQGVAEHVERFLEDPSLPPEEREDPRLLLLAGASEIGAESTTAQGLTGGTARVRRALALGLAGDERLFAHLELAEAAWLGARNDEAAQELQAARALAGDESSAPEAARLVTLEARLALARTPLPDRRELDDLRARLERALDTLLEQWSRVPQREGGIGYLLYARRREILGELTRVALALDGPQRGAEAAFAQLLRVQAQGTLARRQGAPPTDLATIRAELLEPGHGLLVYLPAGPSSHLFALDREHLVHASLASSTTIERLRKDYLAHLWSRADDLDDRSQRAAILARERELAAALARELFPSEVQELLRSWSAVTIVGLDVLGPLPFEWLPFEGHDYLGVERALDSLPALPLGVAWARRPSRRFERDYLLVGGVEPGPGIAERWPGLEPIPLTQDIEQELCAAFAPGRSAVLRGAHATRAELFSPALRSTRVLQFLVHGVQELDRDPSLALLLSPAPGDARDDGLLRWKDVADAHAPALVLLTGCRTGAGPLRRGDPGIADLAGAWLAAGADAVVLAHADLRLSEARLFSAGFSARVAAGATSAEALRATRAERVRALGAEAPFRFGMLQLVGLGERSIFPISAGPSDASSPPRAGSSWSLGLGLALGLLAGAALAHLRKDPAAAR